MNKKQKISFDSVELSLNRIDFKCLPAIDDNEKISVDLQDLFHILLINENGAQIEVSRKINLIPESIFSVYVSFLVDIKLSNESKEVVKGNIGLIESKINDNIVNIIDSTTVMSRISSIISMITTQIQLNPIVTPPQFIEKND